MQYGFRCANYLMLKSALFTICVGSEVYSYSVVPNHCEMYFPA